MDIEKQNKQKRSGAAPAAGDAELPAPLGTDLATQLATTRCAAAALVASGSRQLGFRSCVCGWEVL